MNHVTYKLIRIIENEEILLHDEVMIHLNKDINNLMKTLILMDNVISIG
jgi:hypothetical protein